MKNQLFNDKYWASQIAWQFMIISLVLLFVIIAIFVSLFAFITPISTNNVSQVQLNQGPVSDPTLPGGPRPVTKDSLATFASCEELSETLELQSNTGGQFGDDIAISFEGSGARQSADSSFGLNEAAPAPLEAKSVSRYSTTNVQVQGIDEPDIVKTDGRYIYVWSPTKLHLSVLEATPANQMKTIATIPYKSATVSNFFLDGNKLAIFGTNFRAISQPLPVPVPFDPNDQASDELVPDGDPTVIRELTPFASDLIAPASQETFLDIYDVSDPKNPVKERSIGFEGNYTSARLKDGHIYLALTGQPKYYTANIKPEEILPNFRDSSIPEDADSYRPITSCDKVLHMGITDPNNSEQFISHYNSNYSILAAVSLYRNPNISTKVILAPTDKVYMSHNNFYLTEQVSGQEYWNYNQDDLPPGVIYHQTTGRQKTIPVNEGPATRVHQFALNGTNITHNASGIVRGKTLNQFSMDESNGFFRIATTHGFGENSASGLYVFDKNLNPVSFIDEIAPGEQIFSARFMGDRAYLVTFEQIDPFFTIDLSDPYRPRILGQLKIPGFSQYLHPIGTSHVIGLGKQADLQGSVEGVKLSLFDVTDPTLPEEIDVVELGGPGSNSEALNDHKAFLYDPIRSFLVIPVTLTNTANSSGASVDAFQGAYVFKVTEKEGFTFQGRLTHQKTFNDIYNYNTTIRRSLYIDDTLYTISNANAAAHNLKDLTPLSLIEL